MRAHIQAHPNIVPLTVRKRRFQLVDIMELESYGLPIDDAKRVNKDRPSCTSGATGVLVELSHVIWRLDPASMISWTVIDSTSPIMFCGHSVGWVLFQ